MPSLRNTVLVVAAALVANVQADYSINPGSVSASTRKNWCANELNSCPLICQQTEPFTTLSNTCDPDTLTYGCVCGNGLQPNVSEYSLTLPFFVCQEWGNQCVTACGMNNNECASDCREKHPCGALNPTLANETTASSVAPTASATGGVFTGLPQGASNGEDDLDSFATTLEAGRSFGLVLVVGGLVAGMGLML